MYLIQKEKSPYEKGDFSFLYSPNGKVTYTG